MENAKDYDLGSWIDQYFAPQMMGGWEAISPTKDLVDLYECTDGKSISESALYDENNPFANRDPRLDYTILYDGSVIAGKTYSSGAALGNSTRTGYSIRKYINPENDGMNYPGWTNFIYIRYAEILLIYAEAKNEVSGPDESVYKAVNDVRDRVGLPALPDNLTKEEIDEAYEKNTGVLIVEHFKGTEYMAMPAVLCKNHGPFTWGTDPHNAVHNAVVLEEVAKMAARCEMINPDVKPAPQELQDKHYYRKHGKDAYYGQG